MKYYKAYIYLSIFVFLTISCTSKKISGDADRFKKGVFEIPASKNFGKTTITRIDSLHIEKYTTTHTITKDNVTKIDSVQHTDTLYIKWKNNFFYTLRMKSPKKKSDKTPIFVQITKVTDSSYHFSAKVGFSNFKQKGVVYKIK